MSTKIRRGDVYWAELPKLHESSIQYGVRPIIITSNDYANKFSSVIQYIPITTKVNKCKLPVHVLLDNKFLPIHSLALVEQEGCIDKHRIKEYICTLSNIELMDIDMAIMKQRGIDLYKIYKKNEQYNCA